MYRYVFLIVVPLLILNLIQLKFINNKANNNYQTISVHDNNEIFLEAQDKSPTARGIFSSWTILKKIAPNSTFFLSKDLTSHKDNANLRTHAYGIAGSMAAKYYNFSADEVQQIFNQVNNQSHIAAFSQNVSNKTKCFVIYTKSKEEKDLKKLVKGVYFSKTAAPQSSEFVVTNLNSYVDLSNNKESRCESGSYLTFIDVRLLPEGIDWIVKDDK